MSERSACDGHVLTIIAKPFESRGFYGKTTHSLAKGLRVHHAVLQENRSCERDFSKDSRSYRHVNAFAMSPDIVHEMNTVIRFPVEPRRNVMEACTIRVFILSLIRTLNTNHTTNVFSRNKSALLRAK